MRPIHYIILFLISGTVMCTKNVALKFGPVQKRLVVHGFVAAGEYFRVAVARTTRTDQRDDYWRPEALVLLYSGDVLLDTLKYDNNANEFYTAKVVAETNTPYTLRVSAPGYPSVEATEMAPALPVSESFEHRKKSRQLDADQELDEVIFSFRDAAQVRNYYMVMLRPPQNLSQVDCVYTNDPAIERTTRALLPFDHDDCISGEGIFIPDKSFDGQLKTLNLAASSYYFEPQTSSVNFGHAYLKRYALTETAYNYLKFVRTLDEREGLPFLNESTDSRSNVKGGHGLFTIYDQRVDSIY